MKFDPLRDYAIEVEIRVTDYGNGGTNGFGAVLRELDQRSYRPVIEPSRYSNDLAAVGLLSSDPEPLYFLDHEQDTTVCGYTEAQSWHTYRFEVQANHVRVLVDGTPVLDVTDNTILTPGGGGFWVEGNQLEMRAFRIIAE